MVAPKVLDEEHWKLTAGALSALGASVLLTCSLANVGAQLGQSAGSHKFGRKIIIRVVASPHFPLGTRRSEIPSTTDPSGSPSIYHCETTNKTPRIIAAEELAQHASSAPSEAGERSEARP